MHPIINFYLLIRRETINAINFYDLGEKKARYYSFYSKSLHNVPKKDELERKKDVSIRQGPTFIKFLFRSDNKLVFM